MHPLAAFEGLWQTQTNAPLLVFGTPNPKRERTAFALKLLGALSIRAVLASIGIPLVIGYTISIYRTSSGPVKVESP